MITLYSFGTPHGHRASIMLEELGLSWQLHKVDFTGEGVVDPVVAAISPLGKIPVMVETLPDGRTETTFESGAILLHLARRSGQFLPEAGDPENEFHAWLMLVLTDLTQSLIGQFRFSVLAPEPVPYAVQFYTREAGRCLDALECRLSQSSFIGGSSYTIVDIAAFPFIEAASRGGVLNRRPALKRWLDTVSSRPAVRRGMAGSVFPGG